MKGCAGNPECGERESERFAGPVWQSRSGWVPVWAASPRGGSVWPALTVGRERGGEEGGREGDWESVLFFMCELMVLFICMQSGQVPYV